MGRRKKRNLSLYVSKNKNKMERGVGTVGTKVKCLGRPRSLKRPLPTRDLDETLPYEQFTTDECPTDEGDEMDFQFSVSVPPEDSASKTCAGAGPDSSPSNSHEEDNISLSSSESSNSDDEDGDIWNRPFVKNCFAQLTDQELIRNLVQRLYIGNCLPDFMLLITQLADGSLSPSNIALLLCLERARWNSLKTTTQMRFRSVTKKFWLVVYRLLKGKGLRFFSGPKNYGQVISKKTKKGKYNPNEAEVNFAVPDERYLRQQDQQMGRIIQPGLIEESMKMIKDHDDIVLMADCKRVAKGLRSDNMGDVNLWGHEHEPTLQEKLHHFREECLYMNNLIQSLPDADADQCHVDLKYILQLLTTKIRDIRTVELQERKRLINYEKCNPDPTFKASAKGACRAHIYECKTFITHALQANQTICKCLSFLQKTSCCFNSVRVSLEKQVNVRRLHSVNYVELHTTIQRHPEWFKQLSVQWRNLRSKAHITGSTAYNAMGFRGFAQVRNHFREFIYKKGPAPVDPAAQQRMQHGRDHEIHGTGTVAAVFMPALLPGCATLYEVGGYTKDGDNVEGLLVDSPDGFIKIDHDASTENCCDRFVHNFNADNISVELKSPYPDAEKLPVHYKVPKWYIIQILIHMVVTETDSNWYGCCGTKSMVLIECRFDEELWDKLWHRIKQFLDKDKPVASNWMKEISQEFRVLFENYILECTDLIGEVPVVTTVEDPSQFRRSTLFSPYHKPTSQRNRNGPDLDDVKEIINSTYLKANKLIRDAYHILREEACEILAFVAADSSRVPTAGLPRNIPIAYGLKGHSLPMSMMRGMVHEVRNKCLEYNVNVRCEIYDGQFLNLVRYSEDGSPLTRLSFLQWFFKQVQSWTKAKCVDYLVTEALPNGIPLNILVTPNKINLWKKHVDQVNRRRENRPQRSTNNQGLDPEDLSELLRGSQLGSRMRRQIQSQDVTADSDDEDSADDDDENESDADYIANDSDIDDINFDSDNSSDLEQELEDIIADAQDIQDDNQESTFLEDLLQKLRDNRSGKINWLLLDVDDLVNDYLKNPTQCLKLVHDELNIICNLIQIYTGVKVFNTSDLKADKINKLVTNFSTSSQQLIVTTRKKYKVKSLHHWARLQLMNPMYPKLYLQIVVANAIFAINAADWLQSSTVQMSLSVNLNETGSEVVTHHCHSYPELNEDRQQSEYRTIDPGHTLANMRSQISRYGYDFCSKAAFVRVSETNHDVLPKSILEDRLDRQSIRIAKRFFSEEVQNELQKNGDKKEAKFVQLVRNWFQACDERGIDVYTRMKHLNEFSKFLAGLVQWTEMPPPINYIKGMPVPTYESLMQGISTRLQIYVLSTMPINQRSISTVGIESFFSDITHMEFSGLGCPKAVDIPRLITHVTELNTIRHDPNRGFVFSTTNRGAYPYDTLLPPSDVNQTRFDLPRPRKQRKAPKLLALPKAITRGQLTIREFHRKDEGKIPLDKRAGVPVTFNAMDPT